MKKSLILLAIVAFGVALLGSCKSTHDCPAYSNNDIVKTEQPS